MIKLDTSKLFDLLPVNLRNDKDIVAACIALDAGKDKALEHIRKLDFKSNSSVLDHRILDALADDQHVDFYDKKFPANVKRSIVDSSLILHMLKGTAGSIERALQTINVESEVEEWFDYKGQPFHFIVEIAPEFSIADRKMMESLVATYKNERSWFDGFVILLNGSDIVIMDNSYHYPVLYKTCGEFSGEKEFSHSKLGAISIANDTYDFSVDYPICEKEHSQANLSPVAVADESYDYLKHFPVAGEMETLAKKVTTLSAAIDLRSDPYDYTVAYPVCGDFYAEGDE